MNGLSHALAVLHAQPSHPGLALPGFSSRRLAARMCACILAALVPATRTAAQMALADPPATRSPAELKRMSVEELLAQDVLSVSRRPEAWGSAASNVFFMSGDAARTTGATSLPELLRLAPSLFVAQSSAYHWGIDARGFMRTNAHSNKLLVLVDGRSVYSPLFSNVFWDSTDVFLPDLESVEVIAGPSGANWGANAVNGVINIRSKSARDTIGTLVSGYAGTEVTQVGVREGVRLGDDGAARVYAKWTDHNSTLSPTGADDGADDWHSLQAGFRADWGSADRGEFTFQGDWYSGRYQNAGLRPIANDGGNAILRWDRELSSDSRLWVRAYYDYVVRDSSGLLTETTRTADLEFQQERDFANGQKLLWGADLRHIDDAAEDTVGFAILPVRLGFNLGSAFVQHEIGFLDNSLRLTTGWRMEHNHFSDWESQPTVRLAWRGRGQTAWFGYSRAARTPSRLDTGFFAPKEPPYTVIGGPNFTSETLNAYELGWRGQPVHGLAVTATVYYHDYDNLRTVEPTTPVVEANGGEGSSYGTELFVDYDVTPWWRLRAGGFLMRQENWLKPWSADLEHAVGEASFPRHQELLRSSFRLNRRTDLWLGLRHVDAVPAFENGNGEVPAYTELDARLGWQVRPGFELALVGRNLLHKSHPEIGGALVRREIPRSVGVSVRWQF
ncbi:MAG TPA: TonB-dependent receptor [Lacunisphaera sp.]|nr:TonB-dependent receptor [Lacunisphaera sp.]